MVENAPCDVTVVKCDGPDEPGKILIPTVGGPHSAISEDIAITQAEANDLPVTILTVTTED